MKITKPIFLLEAERKLKVIWDLLKKKNVIGFRMTIKLYYEDRGDPFVISMKGVRADNGEWSLQPPPRHRIGPSESNVELQEKLEAIEASIKNYISTHSLDEAWREWLDALTERMKLGCSTEDLEFRSEIPVRAIASYGYDAHFFAPVMAMAYVIEGTEALARNDMEQASRSAERGTYWSREEMLIADPANRFVERAHTGGGGKAARYEDVKKKVAELLRGLRPEGWDSRNQAVDEVADELTKKHSAFVEESGLKTENLARTIKDWMKKAPDKYPHMVKAKK
ncbi:hypothetical protein [Burkholderia gladioli]|uniref:hypothetical protein n=1 Tax=Burkholderia gladioli TaxID=28095 RepID=UPI001C23E892|nr:hypothetical protein [Burkholderia gladioli]MBU9169563.1 hypothetical protein [Burkholderia gladioli]